MRNDKRKTTETEKPGPVFFSGPDFFIRTVMTPRKGDEQLWPSPMMAVQQHMLPVMTVPAYADEETVELGSVWVQYVDSLTYEEIAGPTLFHYEDGACTIEAPTIAGYTYSSAECFNEGITPGGKNHSVVTKTGSWSVGPVLPLNCTLDDENDWYKIRLTRSHTDNGRQIK